MKAPALCLLTVEEAFHISGRGCLLTPGLASATMPPIKRGDVVSLVRPDGKTSECVIHGLDAVHNRHAENPEIRFFLTLSPKMKKDDVPRGTKVFCDPAATAKSGASCAAHTPQNQ